MTQQIFRYYWFTWEDNVPRGTTSMKIKDHFLSGEFFELVKNNQYDYYVTKPGLKFKQLQKYYDTESYVSHQEKSNDLKSFIYNLVKKFMIRQKYKWIAKFVDNGNWLDFGAGTGEFLTYLPNDNWDKVAFEPNLNAIERIKNKKIKYISDYQYNESYFDVITAFHAIEHVNNIDNWFDFIKRISKKDTIVAVAVPNYKSYDAKYYKKFWAAYDVPRHQYHFSKKSIYKLFIENGFQLVGEKPLPFDAYYISMISEKYKSQSNLLNALRIGFLSNQKANKTKEYSSNLFIFSRLQR